MFLYLTAPSSIFIPIYILHTHLVNTVTIQYRKKESSWKQPSPPFFNSTVSAQYSHITPSRIRIYGWITFKTEEL
ncbi:hypothetical protein P8452_21380 [Trifolium repens]|nr:hypothetical protein P8452_21380 [Trifolium repens]